ncbi:hypothetical protein SAMN05421688_0009 [Poseidonocella pacifica]|uniref:Uncharacterized protein n=1 Tax=Poseidonocella pacifica TaxID=871651 RepID=A0A1I0YZH8_9RHOB|nr:hypothetical protein [Poseidonocella pacifica]SFB18764.1 hypothetical protein SAMN05421688_0009 [Poseidonocella pacifica]
MRALICVAVSGLLLAGQPALAKRVSKNEVGMVAQAAERCAASFPDMTALSRSHRAGGLRNEGTGRGIQFFSGGGRDVLVANSTQSSDPWCMFSVDGLQENEADALLHQLIAANGAKISNPLDPKNRRNMWSAYAVEFNGRIYFAGVTRVQTFGPIFRGSLIVFRHID